MRPSLLLRAAALAAVLTAAACFAPVVNVFYPASTKDIQERARGEQPPLWKVPLGPASIEEMQQLAPDRLFLALRRIDASMTNMDYLLVDTDRGRVVWRYAREPEGEYGTILATRDLILFRRDLPKSSALTALDGATGKVLWSRAPGPAAAEYLPLLGRPLVAAVEPQGNVVRISALDLHTGRTVWTREFPADPARRYPVPVVTASGLVHFYGSIELLADRDGGTVWKQAGILTGPGSPPPQPADGSLAVIDGGKKLHLLSTATGKQLLSVPLDAGLVYTNIFPLDDTIYLRAEAVQRGAQPFRLIAVRKTDGSVRWSYGDTEASVSGMVRMGRRLYFATPATLVALDAATGKRLFKVNVATTGRTYPVHVREVRGRIVYIGELVIAAYDASSGRQLYSIGTSPVEDLDGLDLLIKRYQKDLVQREGVRNSFSWSEQYRQEAVRYQNLSNQNFRLGMERYGQGKYWEAQTAYAQSQIDSAYSKAQSQLAFYSAMNELAESMNRAFKAQEIRGTIAMNRFLRKSVLAAYDAAETGDYVFRPDQDDGFDGLTVIRLSTGAHRRYEFSPAYEEYGIWNLVDPRKGIIYTHGIGMDTSAYTFAEPFTSYRGQVKVRQYNGFLIARKVDLPK